MTDHDLPLEKDSRINFDVDGDPVHILCTKGDIPVAVVKAYLEQTLAASVDLEHVFGESFVARWSHKKTGHDCECPIRIEAQKKPLKKPPWPRSY